MDVKLLLASYLDLAKELPIEKNDILFLASDLHTIIRDCRERNETFDVNLFIDSFKEVLSEGTLVIPSFTEYLEDKSTFNVNESSPQSGALSSFIWKKGVLKRTPDPLYSVFVWGKHEEEILSLSSDNSFGPNSIFDFLYRFDAKMISIDIHIQDSLKFAHYVEQKLNVRHRKMILKSFNIENGQDVKEISYKHFEKKGWALNDYHEVQPAMGNEKVKTNFIFDNSKIQYFRLRNVHDFLIQYIKSGRKLYQIDLLYFVKRLFKKR